MQEYVHRRHARAGSDGDSRRCHKSLQGSRPSGNIISPKCIAFALVMATPGTRGMIQLMMTVSIFSAGIHILSPAAVTAMPAVQRIFRIKLLIRTLFPIVMRAARMIPHGS